MEDVVLTAPILPAAMQRLETEFRVHRLWEAADTEAFFAGPAGQARYVAAFGPTPVDAAMMDRMPNLALISNYGVGVDPIDLEAARARGIRVTNTPDVLNDAVAELAIGLMLAVCRRIVDADRFVREGRWPHGPYPLTGELTGQTVGILGLGRIGKEIARRAQVFRMQVVYHGRHRQPHQPYPYYADLTEMARDADWLVAVVPGDTGTRGLVSREVLEALGPEGGFINLGRGSLVDEAALLDLLQSGGLGGAGLDVFADEPNMSPDFWKLSNVVLSPHQGSATVKTRTEMGNLMIDNLIAHRDGKPLISPVV